MTFYELLVIMVHNRTFFVIVFLIFSSIEAEVEHKQYNICDVNFIDVFLQEQKLILFLFN